MMEQAAQIAVFYLIFAVLFTSKVLQFRYFHDKTYIFDFTNKNLAYNGNIIYSYLNEPKYKFFLSAPN